MHNITHILGSDFMVTFNNGMDTVTKFFKDLGPLGQILLVFFILWIGKFVVKCVGKLVEKALSKTSLDDKIAAKFGHDANVTGGIVGFVKALLFLFILIFALNAAELGDVSGPLTKILGDILGFIPNLLVAGVLAYVVILIAGLIKQIISDLLTATKVDERLGSVAGTTPISNAVATAAYAFFLLLFIPAVLDALKITAVSEPIKEIVEDIIGAVPNIILAGVIIFLGCLIGNIAKRLVTNLLQATNVDSFPAKLGINVPASGARSISSIAGVLVMVTVIVISLTAAIKELNVEILSSASEGLYEGYFRILLALIILVGGLIGARFAHDNLVEGNPTLAKYAKFGIIVLTVVIALNRSGLASGLTDLPYEVAIYAAGVAFGIGGAIAIGLGGQGYVARWFEKRG